MKPGAIGVDDAKLSDPVAYVGIVFQPPKENQTVSGNRPRRLKVPMPFGDWLTLRLPQYIHVDFAVFVVRRAVTILAAGDQRSR